MFIISRYTFVVSDTLGPGRVESGFLDEEDCLRPPHGGHPNPPGTIAFNRPTECLRKHGGDNNHLGPRNYGKMKVF